MCLVLFAYKSHPQYKLIVAANRDEFYNRPTAPAEFWKDDPQILAGRDLQAGGTWMGINKKGKVGILTNYRDMVNIISNAPSRGHLVSDFLQNDENAIEYLNKVAIQGHLYNGFNIICGNVEALYFYSNYADEVLQIEPGLHGLSNALLNSNWPKINKGLAKLKLILDDRFPDPKMILQALYDDIKAPHDLLPNTGVGTDLESMLSPMFIKSPDYGSRCSTVLMIDNENQVHYLERTYDVKNFSFKDRRYDLHIPC